MSDAETSPVENNAQETATESNSESPLQEIVSPSKKKRKLESPAKPKFDIENDDGSICSICLDNFQSTGPHRIVSLKCGHIFGESCIRQWSNDQKNCPQCKRKALVKDFRPIFAAKIQVVDNYREMQLEMRIQQLENEKRDLIVTNSTNSTTIALQKRIIKDMQAEIDRYKSLTLSRNNTGIDCIQVIKGGRMYLEKNIDFKDNSDCRIIKFMIKSKKLIVAQKSVGTTLFSGYGTRFIDAATYRCEKFINISSKAVIDISFDSSESLLACSSREPVCKIYGVNNCQSVASLVPATVPIWCCSFNKNRDNQILLGAQNGSTYVFDTKRPSEILCTLASLDNKTPVKCILSMNKTESFPFGGFFVVHVRGFYFYEQLASLNYKITKLNFEDSILSASYDHKTEMLLISTPTEDRMTHILMRLIKADEVPVLQEVYRIQSNQMALSRPAQIKVPDGFIVTSYANDMKEIQAHAASVGKLHSIPTHTLVSDFCPVYTENTAVTFAALSSTKCRIYKVNLEYS